jgi:hypothetical protein
MSFCANFDKIVVYFELQLVFSLIPNWQWYLQTNSNFVKLWKPYSTKNHVYESLGFVALVPLPTNVSLGVIFCHFLTKKLGKISKQM